MPTLWSLQSGEVYTAITVNDVYQLRDPSGQVQAMGTFQVVTNGDESDDKSYLTLHFTSVMQMNQELKSPLSTIIRVNLAEGTFEVAPGSQRQHLMTAFGTGGFYSTMWSLDK